jgi:Cu(I)/Ag(I) efflux system membrane fusion protein
MKKLINNIKDNYKLVTGILITGIVIGWAIFGLNGRNPSGLSDAGDNTGIADESPESTVWTCSMHPQIKQDKPGDCPICGMDLIPLQKMESAEGVYDPNEIMMSDAAAKLAEVQTTIVTMARPEKTIHLQGKVEADERKMAEITSRFGGRIEKLFVNFTGDYVGKGDKLATIYSPELVTAQKELLEAYSMKDSRPGLYEAARTKLLLWDLTADQIRKIEDAREPLVYFDVLSPISGTIMKRNVSLGDYVKQGDKLFMVTDLSRLWVMFDAYESDLPWIKTGDRIEFEVRSLPSQKFKGKVAYVDPFIDPITRSAKVRVDIDNPGQRLKPQMFAGGLLYSSTASDTDKLLVPKSAVLWTGKRSVVYVRVPDRESPTFIHREITLGAETGNYYVVVEGLKEGEEIATNGVFKVDAAAQLEGKRSMMNRAGSEDQNKTGHDHTSNDDLDHSASGMQDMRGVNETDQQVVNINRYEVDPLFRKQLTGLYETYLPMKDAFVETNPKKVRKAAKKLMPAIEGVNMNLLEGQAHMEFMDLVKILKESVFAIQESKDIEVQRKNFSDFNNAFYRLIKSFGLEGQKVYYQFCPMAFNDKGAFWLSSDEEISNPYFGDVMLRCGEVKEVIDR